MASPTLRTPVCPQRVAQKTCGFTLIELLAVIAIIAILAALLFPSFRNARLNANKTQSMSNLRQLAAGMMNYASENNGEIPPPGVTNPTWAGSAQQSDVNSWYNSVPRHAGAMGLADFANNPGSFYTSKNLTFVSAAKYPTNSTSAPLYAISMNSKLHDSTQITNDATVRMAGFLNPSETMAFQESGLSGETTLSGQSAGNYNGQPTSYATGTVARYNGYTLMVMLDGHAESFIGSQVVSPSGNAYNPQNLGKVYWTMDPTVNANN